jgi:predicted permease
VAGFAVGAGFGARAGEGARQRARAFVLRNPPLWAALAGLAAPDALAPQGLVEASRVAVLAILPLGFFAVGALLAQEARAGGTGRAPTVDRGVAAALALRLLVAPALLLALSAPLIDLPPAYLLLAAMPCGINALAVAHVYGLALRIPAAAIAWGTGLVMAAAVAAAAIR